MLSQLAMLIAVLGIQPGEETAHTVLSKVRESSTRLDGYVVHAQLITYVAAKDQSQTIPLRPASLPKTIGATVDSPGTLGGAELSRQTIEERFSRWVGRSLIRKLGPKMKTRVESAVVHTCTSTDNDATIAVRDTADDFLWSLRPRYADIDLIEMLDTHPDVRLSKVASLLTIDIPIKSLVEYSELGARLLVDSEKDYAIVGIDLYVAGHGQEQMFRRVDIKLGRVSRSGRQWLPHVITRWQKPAPSQLLRQDRPEVTALIVDMDASGFDAAPSEQDVRIAELAEQEGVRIPLDARWDLVLYRPPTERIVDIGHHRMRRIVVVIGLNLIAFLALLIWVFVRGRRRWAT